VTKSLHVNIVNQLEMAVSRNWNHDTNTSTTPWSREWKFCHWDCVKKSCCSLQWLLL